MIKPKLDTILKMAKRENKIVMYIGGHFVTVDKGINDMPNRFQIETLVKRLVVSNVNPADS